MEKEDIIIAAVQSLGAELNGKSADQAEALVTERVLSVKRLVSETSEPYKALDATAIRATIKSVSIEERTGRGIIEFIAANSEDGKSETIRTPHLNRCIGKSVFEKAQASIGKTRVIHKINEEMAARKGHTVRIAIGIS